MPVLCMMLLCSGLFFRKGIWRVNILTSAQGFETGVFIFVPVSNAKNIVILGPAYPFRGGIASYNERLALTFRHEGHHCKILTFTTQYPSFLFPGKTQFSESPPPDDVRISREVSSVNPLTWLRVGRKLKKEKPDILLFRFWLPFMAPCFGTVARIVRKNNHTKIVCLIDNIIPHEKRIGDQALTSYFVNSMDAFVAMSQNVLQDLNQFDKNKPRTLHPHPVFDNFGEAVSKKEACEKLNLNSSSNYILFFGFIRDYKGLDILLEAMDDERVRQHQVKLIVAGEFYGNERKYFDIIERNQLENQLILANHFIKDEEVKYYFSVADVVVQPYKNATQSGVTQIAYQFEKPMIVTNVGGLPELVPHNIAGWVVDANPREIAKAIDLFFSGDKNKFTSGLIAQKEKFGWDKMANKILEFCE